MRNVLTLLLVLYWPTHSFCAQKILVVPDKYPTIQKAIDSAQPGDKITIKRGFYAEQIIFKDGIDIEGDDQNSVIISCDANSGSVIAVDNCGSGSISRLTVEHTGRENVHDANATIKPIVMLNSSGIKITGCRIQNGGGNGITIKAKGDCEVSDCIIQNNKINGICIRQEGMNPVINNNKCLNNGNNGISVISGTASPKLTNNLCSENSGSGIYFGDGAKGTAASNICTKNKWHGISIAEDNCSVIVENNQCSDNKKCGIYYSRGTHSAGSGNVVKDNGEINFRQLRIELWAQDFDGLEQTAAKLRSEKSRFSRNGNWQLRHYYYSLGECWADYKPSVEGKLFEILNNWIEAKPNSITPRIVMAYAYRDYAWHARGCGYADTVSDEMWKVFRERLSNAWNVLEEAEKLPNNNDPVFYNIFFIVGKGLSKSDKEVGYLFNKGAAIERGYFPIYTDRAYFLLPRWGGEYDDAEKFARESEKSTGDLTEFIYARIAANLVCVYGSKDHNEFKTLGFLYPSIKVGHIGLLKKYPEDTYHLNTYCLLASVYEDKETAKELFEKIGNNWDKSVWKKEEYFKKYKELVYSEEKEIEKNSEDRPTSRFRRALRKILD